MQRTWISSPSYAAALSVIIESRKSKSLSQRDLASLLGKPRSFVSKIENRERRIDVVEFIALARALGINPADLIERIVGVLGASLEF